MVFWITICCTLPALDCDLSLLGLEKERGRRGGSGLDGGYCAAGFPRLRTPYSSLEWGGSAHSFDIYLTETQGWSTKLLFNSCSLRGEVFSRGVRLLGVAFF